MGLLEAAQQVHAVAVGQLQVGDDEVRRFLLLLLVGLEAGADGQHGDLHPLQRNDKRPPDDRIVLHDHDFFKPERVQSKIKGG